jgi:hypothetical protein
MLRQVDKAIDNGIAKEKLILDPGIGFAKNYAQNIQIIRELKSFTNLSSHLVVADHVAIELSKFREVVIDIPVCHVDLLKARLFVFGIPSGDTCIIYTRLAMH